ncbi:hypothetical protein [Deinococcus wulumuqiensis]|uniref:hypothetical protein n=1 Tax=Deinococcus wulumuqiensis TaxID=980427 RepID=UPI00243309D4|nr:hypothetical protein [Deinococcus wulumuqiensis]
MPNTTHPQARTGTPLVAQGKPLGDDTKRAERLAHVAGSLRIEGFTTTPERLTELERKYGSRRE